MAEDWLQIAAEVDAALKSVGSTDAGFSATLSQTTMGGTDPWNPVPTTTNTAVTVVVTDYRRDEVDGTVILATDRKVLMTATAGVVPKPADRITISGQVHQIINVMPLAPAGVAVMYECQVRA